MINKILSIYILIPFSFPSCFVLPFFFIERQKYKHQSMITKCLNYNRVVMRNAEELTKKLNNKIVSEFVSEGCS